MKRKKTLILISVLLTAIAVTVVYVSRPDTRDSNDYHSIGEKTGEVYVNGNRIDYVYFHVSENSNIIVPFARIAHEFNVMTGFPEGISFLPGEEVSIYGRRIAIYTTSGEIINTVGSNRFLLDKENGELELKELSYVIYDIDGLPYVPIQFFVDILGVESAYYKDGSVHINGDVM